MRAFLSLILLLVPCVAYAGETVVMTVGALRRDYKELREWSYYEPLADKLLTDVQAFADNDTYELDTNTFWHMNKGLAEWRAEKTKSKLVRVIEAANYARGIVRVQIVNGEQAVVREDIWLRLEVFIERLQDIK